jgi:Zn-dependent protease
MLFTLVAFVLCLITAYTLRGGYVANGRFLRLAGFDPNGLILGVLAVAAAVYFCGEIYGLALILSIMLHEFGHVAAFRICGHSDARFRLIPMIGGVAISSQLPASHEKDLFITLMGPGICLAPTVLAMALLELDWTYDSGAAEFVWIFATVTAAINFFNLLPFWPLDGGRSLAILCRTFIPGAAKQATMAMAAATIVLGIYSQSMAMLFFALMGAQSLILGGDVSSVQRPMSKQRGALGAAAHLTALAAFGLAGWPLLSGFF